MTNQIIPVPNNNGSALSMFSDFEDVERLGNRLRKLMPGAQVLTENEAKAVAQVALAHGLDPFNGEVWGLKKYDGTWLGVMIGIKGHRRAATRQAVVENTTYWGTDVLVPPSKYQKAENAVVYEYHLRDTVRMQAWGKSLNIVTTAGVPYAQAIEMVGPAPVVVGVGIATPDEKSKMEIHARAKKRAEADALKKRFDVEFVGAFASADADMTEGDYRVVEAESYDVDQLPRSNRSEAELIEGLGYTAPAPVRQAEPELMDLAEAKRVQNSKGEYYWNLPSDTLSHMANAMAKSLRKDDITNERKAELEHKMQAAVTIMAYRNEAQPEGGAE